MATKAKDHSNSTSTKKERFGSTSSNSQAKTTSAKHSTTQGSSSTHKTSSSSTEKQVPNYLKPTISSRHESTATPKPTLNRRRSFDNKPAPPQSSRPQKAAPERLVPARSSPFSSKSTSKPSPRPTSKPQTLYSKGAKKSKEIYIRREGSSGRVADPKSSAKDNNEVVKDEVLAKESLVLEVVDSDDMVVDGDGDDHHETELVKVAPEDEPKYEDNHDHENVDDHGHDQEETMAKPCDITIVSEELARANDDVEGTDDHNKVESGEEEKPGEESEVGEEDHNKDENSCSTTITTTTSTSEINDQSTEKGIENEEEKVEEVIKEGAEKVAVTEESEELENKGTNNNGNDDKEGTENEEVKTKELGETSDDKVEAKSEEVVKGSSGKKESQVAYNDVIEETASKLLEKRKNKVKALVGAFETVIDFESAAK